MSASVSSLTSSSSMASSSGIANTKNLLFSDEEGLQENNEKFKLNGQKYPDLTQDDMSEEIK